jgi:hypothetical protein
VILELERRDTARVITLAKLYLAADSASENRDGMRWALALAKGDIAGAHAIVARRDSLSTMARATIAEIPIFTALGVDFAQRVLDVPSGPSTDQNAVITDLVLRHDLAMNRGRPARGDALLDTIGTMVPGFDNYERVRDALLWDGDTTDVAKSVAALRRKAAGGPLVANQSRKGKDPVYYGDICMAELWTLSQGDTSGARRTSAILTNNVDMKDSLSNPYFRVGCARMLDAQLAVMNNHADAHARIDSLDAFLRTAPQGPILRIGNVVTGRLYERVGDIRAALFAVRRRDFFFGRSLYQSTLLRDEARLAEKLGDAAGAAEALRQYVSLRTDPEPALQRDAQAARDALAKAGKAAAGK